MRQFFHLVFTSLRWFIAFMIFLLLCFLFGWRIIDHEGFTMHINGFLKDINTIFLYLVELSIIVFGLAILFGWRPFRQRNRNRGGGGH